LSRGRRATSVRTSTPLRLRIAACGHGGQVACVCVGQPALRRRGRLCTDLGEHRPDRIFPAPSGLYQAWRRRVFPRSGRSFRTKSAGSAGDAHSLVRERDDEPGRCARSSSPETTPVC
jgi:hypothetical protein